MTGQQVVVITPQSPWYPLVLAQTLVKGGQPRVVAVPFEHWLTWRALCRVPPQSDVDMLVEIHGALAAAVA